MVDSKTNLDVKDLSVSELNTIKLDKLKQSQFRTIIVGCSGSVASIKTLNLVTLLQNEFKVNIVLIASQNSIPFLLTEDP